MKKTLGFLVLGTLALNANARDFKVPAKDADALVQAFVDAAAHPGPDRIILDFRGTYVLTRAHSALLALPPVTDEVKVLGRGSEIRVYSKQPLGLFRVTPTGQLQVFDLVIAGSSHTAMINQGSSQLTQVRFEDNFSRHLAAAIDNQGLLEMNDCSVSFNSAQGAGVVGGILNTGGFTAMGLAMSANQAVPGPRTRRAAAAVYNQGEMQLTDAKIDLNEVIGTQAAVMLNGPRGALNIDGSAIETVETPVFAAESGDQPISLNATRLSAAVLAPIANY
jgi:hypothetical protein